MEEVNTSYDTLKDSTINLKDYENQDYKYVSKLN